MNFNDFKISCKTDEELWSHWITILEMWLQQDDEYTKPLQPFLKRTLIKAILSKHDDPFSGTGLAHLVEELKKESRGQLSYKLVVSYKSQLKKAGWLTQKGKLPANIIKMRNNFREESKGGVKSFNMILKLCVC